MSKGTQVMLTPGAVFEIHAGEGWLTWMCRGAVAVHFEAQGQPEVEVRVDDDAPVPLAVGTTPFEPFTSLQFGYRLDEGSSLRLICVATAIRRATRARQRRAVKAAARSQTSRPAKTPARPKARPAPARPKARPARPARPKARPARPKTRPPRR